MIKWIALGAVAALVLLFIFLPGVAWTLVGLVLLLLALILFVPIGADVAFIDEKFRLAVRADGFAIQLLPRKPADPDKPPKEEKPKEEKEKPEEKPKTESKPKKKRFDFNLDEILELVKKVLKALGKFGKLTVRKFMLHYVAAGQDPYNTAMTYGYVNAALSALAPICANTFNVKDDIDVWTDVDFTTEKMRLDFELSITLRLIQVVHVGVVAAIGVVEVLIRNKKRLKREARLAKQNGGGEANANEQDSDANEQSEKTIEVVITKDEERNDTNGETNGEANG